MMHQSVVKSDNTPTFEDLILWLEEVFEDCPEPIDPAWLAYYVAEKLCRLSPTHAQSIKSLVTLEVP